MSEQPGGETGVVWVESVLDPGEPFRIKLHVGERSWTLGRDRAVRYALAVLQAAHYADHDAATLRLMLTTGADQERAMRLITDDLRPDREQLDAAALAPLGLDIGVTQAGAPFLLLLLDDQPLGHWEVEAAVEHATTVLGAMFSTGLDAALHQALVAQVGLDTGRARNVVGSLRQHRRL